MIDCLCFQAPSKQPRLNFEDAADDGKVAKKNLEACPRQQQVEKQPLGVLPSVATASKAQQGIKRAVSPTAYLPPSKRIRIVVIIIFVVS
jgi:hypothetical protein